MVQQRDVGTMQIGEVAERTQLSLRTIRHYDQVGLVPPSGRSEGGFRLYTEADVERLNNVRRITPLGFSLEETAEILALLEREGRSGDTGSPEAAASLEVAHSRPTDGTQTTDGTQATEVYLHRARQAREKLARKLRQADELILALEDLTLPSR